MFKGSVDRIIAAAALAHRYPKARIVFSGGSANLISDDSAKEADYALSVFESLGIARDRLTMERRSRNTQENAEFSKALASPKAGERWLLVTSAFHMPRSVGVFRKAGFGVEPYPADWRTGRSRTCGRHRSSPVTGWRRSTLPFANGWALRPTAFQAKPTNFFPGPVAE